MKKVGLSICVTGFFLLMFSSCLDPKQQDVDDWMKENLQIVNFQLRDGLKYPFSNIRFTIDQLNGEIFNIDSLPYGTVIEDKVPCSIMYDNHYAVDLVEVYQEVTDETKKWSAYDSLNFNQLVRLDLYKSKKKKNKKSYNIRVNVHQLKPDSMVWESMSEDILPESVEEQKVLRFNDRYWAYVKVGSGYKAYQAEMNDLLKWSPIDLKGFSHEALMLSRMIDFEGSLYLPTTEGLLFYSTDGVNWSPLADAPKIETVVGVLKGNSYKKKPSTLIAVVEEGQSFNFYTMSKDHIWQKGDAVPASFPRTGFSHISYEVGFEPRLLLVAGRTGNGELSASSWETMNGRDWIQVEKGSGETLEPLEGVFFTQYDKSLFIIGGFNALGEATKAVRRSIDRGASWVVDTSLVILPEAFIAQGEGSVIVDDDHYMLLFGGKATPGSVVLNQLWRGRTNHFGFKKD